MASSDSRRTTRGGGGPTQERTPLVGEAGASIKRWLTALSPKLGITLVVGFIGLVFVTVLVALSMRGESSRPGCTLSKSIPQLPAPRATFPTSNATSMAKLAAYIEVYDEGFLPLNIERMLISQEEETIKLEDNCVSVSIGYHNEAEDAMSISGLEWNFQKRDGSANRVYCYEIDPEFKHKFPKSDRYSCVEQEIFRCRVPESSNDRAHAFAQLVIESFELELDGNAEAIRAGKFSKNPYGSSCTA